MDAIPNKTYMAAAGFVVTAIGTYIQTGSWQAAAAFLFTGAALVGIRSALAKLEASHNAAAAAAAKVADQLVVVASQMVAKPAAK